ncbi:ABC transporter permease [Inquilinus sp. CA228]|uniref:ABC transporter permease n=1 Tax=Inquilinus sp. CA228 TaxID=3455609 RepID=UPI003F8D5C2A
MAEISLPPPSSLSRNPIFRALRSVLLLRESWVGLIGVLIVLFWVILAILAPVVAPFPPNQNLLPFKPPGTVAPDGGVFWLGTDQLGRDILSRVIWGARRVLIYAPLATACAYALGVTMGLLAGYKRGLWDDVLSRIGDIILSFPILVLYVVIITTFGPSGINIVLAVTCASAPGIMRIVRGLTLDLRNRDYVAAAQTRGESSLYIMFVEILPNARGPLIVDACLRLGYTIITIGVLGFLGLGLPPPDPDWGGMVNETRAMAAFAPWMTVFPCIAISSLVLGLNLLADGLREISLKD